MSDYLTIWRFTVASEDTAGLVEAQRASVAVTQELSPELLSAELVDLGDGTWLHLVRWSDSDSLERLTQRLQGDPEEAAAVGGMHAFFSDEVLLGHGEVRSG
jgi:hypothetical protein